MVWVCVVVDAVSEGHAQQQDPAPAQIGLNFSLLLSLPGRVLEQWERERSQTALTHRGNLLSISSSSLFYTAVVRRERSLLLFFDCTGLSSHFPPTSFFLGVVVGAAVSLSQSAHR